MGMSCFPFKQTLLIHRICYMKFRNNECVRSYSSKYFTSHNVRRTFLEYFLKEHNHHFIRSSPVVPFCDPSVAFVNAGMNQFKNIFLGYQLPPYKRVTNTQKCIRVGGKHNDLNIVGNDGYHHTFFEMLGNWSFGDYFKKEACEMAWNLLTGPFGLNPNVLYVTYFGGDRNLNMKPDLECKDIWLSIGVPDDRILPFGASENFWEMGLTGPCGPCTEIHIARTADKNQSKYVNKGIPELIELWNVVFVQYNRNLNGTISLLPKYHIDTGMGLERLTAVLQNKISNYDTDLFTVLFQRIESICKNVPHYNGKFGVEDPNSIDTSYRILADHSRMITACLADGMIPDQNQKLRRILRKALLISETVFKQNANLLSQLSRLICENFSEVYPEMEKNWKQIQQIILYEEDVYKSIRSTAAKQWIKILEQEPKLKNLNVLEMPGLVNAYNELKTLQNPIITSELAFQFYSNYGLDEQTIKSLIECLNFKYESNDFNEQLDLAKQKSKSIIVLDTFKFKHISDELIKNDIKQTDDCFKYNYYRNENRYEFENVPVEILSIISEGNIVKEIGSNVECYLVLNQTNLYSESGGQSSDTGLIKFNDQKLFVITDTLNLNGYILHKGMLKTSPENLFSNDSGILSLDEERRLQTMSNHTSVHLLNAALKKVLDVVTCQKSSKVTSNLLSLDVGIYSEKLTVDDLERVENKIRKVINDSIVVGTSVVNSQELLGLENLTLIPGEIYPESGIRIIEMLGEDFISREPCCGTHVMNTKDIKDFCIINCQSLGRSTMSLMAITGERAILAHENGRKIYNEVKQIHQIINDSTEKLENLNNNMNELKYKLNYGNEDVPIYIKSKCMDILNELTRELRGTERDSLKQFIDLEMKTIIEENCNKSNNDVPYIVHFLGCSSIMDSVPLQRATKMCASIPVLVISYSDNNVKARCCVPQNYVSKNFTAKLWLNSVAKLFHSVAKPPKGQDPQLVCNMKMKHVHKIDWELLLENALNAAKVYANANL